MSKAFSIKDLKKVAIVGVGLLGGSIGLALRASGFTGVRVGVGRRAASLRKAIQYDAVDETTLTMADGVKDADLVILCTPISHFEPLLVELAGCLGPRTLVTDVGSTKAHVVRLAGKILPAGRFVGSHPMAGSEKTGVEFARADLFANAVCLVTPTPATPLPAVRWMRGFWEALGGHSMAMPPEQHDRLLARVSHLPHAVATALVRLATVEEAIEVAGPGFGDTTRVASGDPDLWTDIFRTNREALIQAADDLIEELSRFRDRLKDDDVNALREWLQSSKLTRDRWVNRRYRKKEMPS